MPETQRPAIRSLGRLAVLIALLPLAGGCPLENIKPPGSAQQRGAASGGADRAPPQGRVPAGVPTTDCGDAGACREFAIEGDPPAVLPNDQPAPFRGNADPSLRFDPESGNLWMSYSWLSVGLGDRSGGGKPSIDFVVQTHLARSTDKGRSFEFVRSINTNTEETHPDTGERGWMSHEVSALGRNADGTWQTLWISYLDPYGPKKRGAAIISYSSAADPASLGENRQPWIRGKGQPPVRNVRYDLSEKSPVGDCLTFMEPTLFSHGGSDYLAVNCVMFRGGRRQVEDEKLWLFRKAGGDYEFVGALLDHADAQRFGGERLEQAEFAEARDGSILLLATPQTEGAVHYGCYALEVESLETARMAREADGSLRVRHYFNDSASRPNGPGACTYDPRSETGVIIVRRDFDLRKKPPKLRFSLMATGVHP